MEQIQLLENLEIDHYTTTAQISLAWILFKKSF